MKNCGPYSTLDISDDIDDGTCSGPLSSDEALERLQIYGPNKIVTTNKRSWWVILFGALLHPFNLLLFFLSAISGATREWKTMGVMLVMVTLSTLIRFIQEWRSEMRAQDLMKHVALNVTVIRVNDSNHLQESYPLPADQLVPGDWIELSPGDLIPADVEIMDHKDLHVSQAALTGEPLPVHKFKKSCANDPNISASSSESSVVDRTLLPELRRSSVDGGSKNCFAGRSDDLDNPEMCFLGSAVISGVAICRVVRTGGRTIFGQLAKVMCHPHDMNAFERGVREISKAFFWTSLTMAGIVFLLQGFLSKNWYASVMFSLSVAVGLTPEMLPMVVNTCLSKGAIDLSSRGCIVKKLEAIINMGSMKVLCTDKTGTISTGRVALHKYVNRYGLGSMTVLRMGFLNARFQSCKKNPLDAAILSYFHRPSSTTIPSLSPRRKQAPDWNFEASMNFEKIDELPFDFKRRRVSVILSSGEGQQNVLICKGAVEEVLNVCTRVTITTSDEDDKLTYAFSDVNSEDMTGGIRVQLKKLNEVLIAEGFRVIGVAFKKWSKTEGYSREDEAQLTFAGYLAFLDPPKDSARLAVRRLEVNGVTVKMLSGDSPLVCRKVCDQLGLEIDDRQITTGDTLEVITNPEELLDMARHCRIFAKLTPVQKADLVKLMQMDGTVVGFLGDGVNDAAALTEADVGIAVDTGTDVAKESSDIIMLNKDLCVIVQAITIGRRCFGNTMKYIVLTLSSNFGNVFSILTASAWLPYQPIASFHILIQNLLYDLGQISIPWDTMDAEYLRTCHVWSTREILKFMVFMGPWSSIFDIFTFLFMYFYFNIQTGHDPYLVRLFQTTWFTVGLLTQSVIVHIIRTPKWPLLQSCASLPVLLTTTIIIMIGLSLPYIPGIGEWVQMVPIPLQIYPFIATAIVGYAIVAQLAKLLYLKIYEKWY